MQKEIALYTASKVNSEFCWFDIDGDIDPLFKVIEGVIALIGDPYLVIICGFELRQKLTRHRCVCPSMSVKGRVILIFLLAEACISEGFMTIANSNFFMLQSVNLKMPLFVPVV